VEDHSNPKELPQDMDSIQITELSCSGVICETCVKKKRKAYIKQSVTFLLLLIIIILIIVIGFDILSDGIIGILALLSCLVFGPFIAFLTIAISRSDSEIGSILAIKSNESCYRSLGYDTFLTKIEFDNSFKNKSITLGEIGIFGYFFSEVIPNLIRSIEEKYKKRYHNSIVNQTCPKCKSELKVIATELIFQEYDILSYNLNAKAEMVEKKKQHEVEFLYCNKCKRYHKRMKKM